MNWIAQIYRKTAVLDAIKALQISMVESAELSTNIKMPKESRDYFESLTAEYAEAIKQLNQNDAKESEGV